MKTPFYLMLIFIATTGLQAQKRVEPNSAVIADSLKKVFYKNANNAGIPNDKIRELLKIIENRDAVIANIVAQKKLQTSPYSVQDPGAVFNYKITHANKYYSIKIKDLITYEQYSHFVVDIYRGEADEKAKFEFKPLIDSNTNLTNEQKVKLYNMIYGFQLHTLVTIAYYGFDKQVQKSKLRDLQFRFEKMFVEICKELNIKNDKLKESSANNFEWN